MANVALPVGSSEKGPVFVPEMVQVGDLSKNNERARSIGARLIKKGGHVVKSWVRWQVLSYEAKNLIQQEILERYPTGTTRESFEVNVHGEDVRVATYGEDTEPQAKLYYTTANRNHGSRIRLMLQEPGQETAIVTDHNTDALTVFGIHNAIQLIQTRAAMARHPITVPAQAPGTLD